MQLWQSGADPEFLVGGGASIQICQILPKNCMKLRKFWSVGGRPPGIRYWQWTHNQEVEKLDPYIIFDS